MRLPDSERPGGGTALLVALVVVSLILITVYFRESDTGPLHRARRLTQAATSPVAAAGEWLFTPVDAVREWFADLGVSRDDLDTLRTQNAELRQRVSELEEARLENERLREILGFVEARELEAVGARVIGRPVSAWEGTIVIDLGSEDGIEPGMPVLAAQGLLGQTIDVSAGSAKVRLITDQRSGVSALIQSSRAEGIVNGSIEGDLTLDYVSRETTVTVGDVVLTSGMGGVYPKGLLIGEVIDVRIAENDLYPNIAVRPSAQLAGIEEVIVLVGATPDPGLGGGE